MTTMTPQRSREQQLGALKRANEVRTTRASIKRDVRGGRRSIDSLLRYPPAEIATMKVFALLLLLPQYGRVKVSKTLTQTRISPNKTIAGMTSRQRADLLRQLFVSDVGADERRKANRSCSAAA
jgi:hypothetical protein